MAEPPPPSPGRGPLPGLEPVAGLGTLLVALVTVFGRFELGS